MTNIYKCREKAEAKSSKNIDEFDQTKMSDETTITLVIAKSGVNFRSNVL